MNIILKKEIDGHKLYHHFDGKDWHEEWDDKYDACIMVMENHVQELEPVRQQVLAGKLSPLAYHIAYNSFTISLLSSYTEIPKRHVKKHLKPEKFEQLDEETLKKYAVALGISVEELKKV
jgi:hypothetical protein